MGGWVVLGCNVAGLRWWWFGLPFFLFFILLSLGIEDSHGMKERRDLTRLCEEREKKNQIQNYSNCINIHTVEFLHRYSVIEPLMWVVFEPKCVKFTTFCILHRGVQFLWVPRLVFFFFNFFNLLLLLLYFLRF